MKTNSHLQLELMALRLHLRANNVLNKSQEMYMEAIIKKLSRMITKEKLNA